MQTLKKSSKSKTGSYRIVPAYSDKTGYDHETEVLERTEIAG